MKLRLTLVISGTSLWFLAGIVFATGDTPQDPILMQVDQEPVAVDIDPSRPEVWFEIVGDPRDISHLIFETTGSADPVLFLYRNLEDAVADNYMAYDDDSADGYNAEITRFLGYPLPYLLKVVLYDALAVGTPVVGCSSSWGPPEDCPQAGPCAVTIMAKEKKGGGELLAIMRGIRSFVFHGSPRGQELVDLYYRISAEILFDVVSDSEFRNRLFRLGAELLPEMREAVRVGVGDSSGARISGQAISQSWELTELLATRVTPTSAQRLREMTEELEVYTGKPFEEAMRGLGLLQGQRADYTLPEGRFYPVKRSEAIVKFRRLPTAKPLLVGQLFLTGFDDVDSVLGAYAFESAEPMFRDHATGEQDSLSRVFRLRVTSVHLVEELVGDLAGTAEVEYAEPISVMYLASEDLYFPYQYGLEKIDAPAAWEIASDNDPPELVGVIDTGIDWRQGDLIDRTRTDLGWNFVGETNDTMDDYGHGTHVAGIIAAAIDNYYSVAGVAPSAEVVPYKVLSADGSGTWDDVAEAIVEAADAGMKIINLSIGGAGAEVVEVVEDALEYAVQKGVLAVAAAGNDGQEGSDFPASSQHTLSVGSTDEQNLLADTSNWGDLDLVAPGVDVASLFLDGLACYASGTSMATPQVAGVAALVRSQYPDIGLAALKARLLKGAIDLGEDGYDPIYGFGLVNALNSLLLAPDLIFADGFESANTSAWTNTVQ